MVSDVRRVPTRGYVCILPKNISDKEEFYKRTFFISHIFSRRSFSRSHFRRRS